MILQKNSVILQKFGVHGTRGRFPRVKALKDLFDPRKIFPLCVEFSTFGYDYLRLLTGLGGGALFATTGLTPIGVGVGLGHLT